MTCPQAKENESMIEIRWVQDDQGFVQLQQRTRTFCADASGVFCGFGEWSDWVAVPVVHDPFAFTDTTDVFNTRSKPLDTESTGKDE